MHVRSTLGEELGIDEDAVRFDLKDGATITQGEGDSQLRFLDHAFASTVRALLGRTVDTVIAAMEAEYPYLPSVNILLPNEKFEAISRFRQRVSAV